ncbi:hypothetical protein CKM354_000060600 [Cercospora kikuchii]|uniref:Uncharacterized protein n=1 Tax=Cercospora kikuchii TaxID=84275 RepID=A0A9P3C6C2_9PEZI|nr:uncharacterized protein CKM354_000060600 [Cercospora kikuchii]GIZ37148.1 hypothetical protein CKM354_000060600 [Cercospora kikuchii]
MSDLDWEERHFSRDDLLYSMAESLQHETPTRHSRFSWWKMAVIAAREIVEEDDRPSFDASSCYSQGSAPTAITEPAMPAPLRLLTSKAALQPFVLHKQSDSIDSELDSPLSLSETINIEDWPTPPTSAISPTPKSEFPTSKAPWMAASPKRSGSARSPLGPAQPQSPGPIAKSTQPAMPPQIMQPLPQKPPSLRIDTQMRQPVLPGRSVGRTPDNISQFNQSQPLDDELLQCQLAQIRSEVRTLQHKSSTLEEALKQTVNDRIAVLARRVAISPDSCSLTDPILDPYSPVLDRGRPVTRSGYALNEGGFWEGRPSTSLSMLPEIENRHRPSRASRIRPVQSAAEMKRPSPPKLRKKASLSLLPSTAGPPRTDLPSVFAETSPLEPAPFGQIAITSKPHTRSMSGIHVFRRAHKLSGELVSREPKLHKIVDIWRNFGKIGAH